MTTEQIGILSGALVFFSAIPYCIRVYQGKIDTQVTSWALWTLIGLAMLLTYRSSGAQDNLWPAVFGFTNPLVIMLLTARRLGRAGWIRPDRIEQGCIVTCILALGLWYPLSQNKELVQWALYLVILADLCAAVPIIKFVWKNPHRERPFAWTTFAFAYGLAMFAITEHTVANYALPVWMFGGSLFVAWPLIVYRWRIRAPLVEWI